MKLVLEAEWKEFDYPRANVDKEYIQIAGYTGWIVREGTNWTWEVYKHHPYASDDRTPPKPFREGKATGRRSAIRQAETVIMDHVAGHLTEVEYTLK